MEVAATNPESRMDRVPGWELGLHLTAKRAMDK